MGGARKGEGRGEARSPAHPPPSQTTAGGAGLGAGSAVPRTFLFGIAPGGACVCRARRERAEGAGGRARSVAARSGGGPRGRAGRRGGAGGRLAALAADPTNLNRVFIKFYIEPDAAQPVPAGSPPPRQPIGPRGSRGVGPGGEGTAGSAEEVARAQLGLTAPLPRSAAAFPRAASRCARCPTGGKRGGEGAAAAQGRARRAPRDAPRLRGSADGPAPRRAAELFLQHQARGCGSADSGPRRCRHPAERSGKRKGELRTPPLPSSSRKS